VHPRIAFSICELFPDAEQAYIDSLEFLKKWDYKEEVTAPPIKEAV